MKYAYLGEGNTLPVIISATLTLLGILWLLAKVSKRQKKVKEGIHVLKQNAQLLISTNELKKELRKDGIEQVGFEARLRPVMEEREKERSEEEECRLAVISTEFEKRVIGRKRCREIDKISAHQVE